MKMSDDIAYAHVDFISVLKLLEMIFKVYNVLFWQIYTMLTPKVKNLLTDFHYMVSTESAKGCLRTEKNKYLATNSCLEIGKRM
jgi:hypothetical protein